jgi:hypothetical protein
MKKSPRDDDTHKTKPTQQQTLQESKSLKEDTKTIPLKKKKKNKNKNKKKSKPKLLKPIRNQQNNQEQKKTKKNQ